MRLLGIDFGLRKVGVAICLEELSEPVVVWPNDSKLFGRLKKLISAKKLEKVIIGLPEGKMVPKVNEFKNNLSEATGLPVELSSECLTTGDAIDKMVEAGKSRHYRRRMEDAAAAALILEKYLERKNV